MNGRFDLTLKPCGRGNWRPLVVAVDCDVAVGERISIGNRSYWVLAKRTHEAWDFG